MPARLLFAAIITYAVSAFPADAGTIWVAPDVNAFSGDSAGALAEILAGTPSVAALSANTASASDFLGNVTQTTISDLNTATLASFDLLALGGPSFFSAGPLGLNPSEVSNVRSFVEGGGDLLLQVESNNQSDLDSYNNFLTSLGSTIQFTGNRVTLLQDFGTFFQCNACNTLTGGTDTRAQFVDGPFNGELAFASEVLPTATTSPVPLPASAWLLLAAIAGLATLRRQAI